MSENKPSTGEKFDLFSFMPVPTGRLVSTPKSQKGTRLFICVYLAYILMISYTFLFASPPRVNQFSNSLDDNVVYKAPEMAFAFIIGDHANTSFYNPSYFTWTFQQVTVPQDPNLIRNYTTLPLQPCRPDWLKPNFDALCPRGESFVQGLLYGSPVHMYPRMKLVMCKNTTETTCATFDEIQNVVMTGRLYVFLKRYEAVDYMTGERIVEDSPYMTYNYFIVLNQYNRAEVKVQAENITIKPNLFTSFFTHKEQSLSLNGQNTYISQVPTNVTHDMFLWWCSMSDSVIYTTVTFDTLLDVMSKIGAMWTLLFSLFAFYFMKFNKDIYYEKNPQMTDFDERVTPLVAAANQKLTKGDSNDITETSFEKESKRTSKKDAYPVKMEIELGSVNHRNNAQ